MHIWKRREVLKEKNGEVFTSILANIFYIMYYIKRKNKIEIIRNDIMQLLAIEEEEMNLSVFITAAEAGAEPTAGLLGMLLPLALMFGLLYFLMIRPQKKKEKALKEQIAAMTVGDKCITSGGILGKVVNIKEDEVTIQTSPANTLITLRKSAISQVLTISDEV